MTISIHPSVMDCVYDIVEMYTCWGPIYKHGLTLMPAGIRSHRPGKLWYVITYQFPNLNGCPVEFWEWISNSISHFTMDGMIYP